MKHIIFCSISVEGKKKYIKLKYAAAWYFIICILSYKRMFQFLNLKYMFSNLASKDLNLYKIKYRQIVFHLDLSFLRGGGKPQLLFSNMLNLWLSYYARGNTFLILVLNLTNLKSKRTIDIFQVISLRDTKCFFPNMLFWDIADDNFLLLVWFSCFNGVL